MIKITVNPQSEPKSFAFDQELIVIGEGSPETVDICFPAEGLHQNHLRILLKDDGYWVINQANDPFVTFNGQSFGKKKLQEGDLIQIRDHVLRIDELSQIALPAKSSALTEDNYAYPDVDSLANDENPEAWFPSDISGLHHPEKSEASKLSEHHPSHNNLSPLYGTHSNKRWKTRFIKIATFSLLTILTLVGISIFEFYFRAHYKSDREEMWAAESLADYAMALTYAKVYHIAPQKQNWVDPFFIKNNLADLLSTTSIVCGNIDAQGQFCNCPYLLRFYTNRDFSRFLLLAQPEPTLSQWLIPKDTLLIDSNTMQIRTTQDLRTLNRLLSNQNPLDGSNGDEIDEAIQKAKIVTLDALAKGTGKKEFSPPKALNYLKPGAENRIYNAPRYYQFSGTFLKKALTLSEQPLTNHDLSIIQSELSILSKFPDLIFYSLGGMHEALEGQRALKKLALAHPFFTAYILLSEKGDIINSRIVLDGEMHAGSDVALLEKPLISEPINLSLQNKLESDEEILSAKLRAQAEKAQKNLHPLLLNLHIILSETVDKEILYLPESFFELLNSYQEKQSKIRNEIDQTLNHFKSSFPNTDPLLVEKMLREYGLLDIYQNAAIKRFNKSNSLSQKRALFSVKNKKNKNDLTNAQNRWKAYIFLRELASENFQPPYLL